MYKLFDEYILSSNKELLEYDFIYSELAKTEWASTRPRDMIDQSIENSFCIGVYKQEQQIAFARIITDYTTLFYLAEIIVTERYRGQGIGKQILQAINESDEFKSIVGLLGTTHAHDLYARFGFVLNKDRMMIRRP